MKTLICNLYSHGARLVFLVLLSLIVASCGVTPTTSAAANHERTVQRFIDAFNRHDAEAMTSLVADNIEWLSVDGSKITTETSGKAALSSGMRDYFTSCPSCQTQVKWLNSSNHRVSALEIASWQSDGELKNQQSLSVYEFENNKIRRVYYYDAEPTDR